MATSGRELAPKEVVSTAPEQASGMGTWFDNLENSKDPCFPALWYY